MSHAAAEIGTGSRHRQCFAAADRARDVGHGRRDADGAPGHAGGVAVWAVASAGRSLIERLAGFPQIPRDFKRQRRRRINQPVTRGRRGTAPSPQTWAAVVRLIMSPGAPPPLAMKLWLFRRVSGRGSSPDNQSADRIMTIESLEHIMRNRLRMVLRHTWFVAVIATLVVIGAAWAAFYMTTESEHLRIAA